MGHDTGLGRRTGLVVVDLAWDHPHGVGLRAAQRAELAARYGTPDSEPGRAPGAGDIGVFVVAYDGEDPVGCGALRELPAESGAERVGDAELKRMYVRPTYRGTGVARAVLAALEQRARDRGWTRLALETGVGQPDAIRFYTREGYVRIPAFGAYRDVASSLCFAREL